MSGDSDERGVARNVPGTTGARKAESGAFWTDGDAD
jgi:hypothetical protein